METLETEIYIDIEPVIIDNIYLFDIDGFDYYFYYTAYQKSIIDKIAETLKKYHPAPDVAFAVMIEKGIIGKEHPVKDLISLLLQDIDTTTLDSQKFSEIWALRTNNEHMAKKIEFINSYYRPLFK